MKRDILLIVSLFFIGAVFGQGKTSLTINCSVCSPTDSLVLSLQEDRIVETFHNPAILFSADNRSGVFHFELTAFNKRAWISLGLSFQKAGGQSFPIILDEFLVAEGDSVVIHLSPKKGRFRAMEEGYEGNIPILFDSWNAGFSGRGSAKFELLWWVKLLGEQAGGAELLVDVDRYNPNRTAILYQRLLAKSLEVLSEYKSRLQPESYFLLESHIRGHFSYKIVRSLEKSYFYFRKEKTDSAIRVVLDKYLAQGLLDLENASMTDNLSPRYIDYLTKYCWLVYTDEQEKNKQIGSWYYFLKNRLKASYVRDRIFASLLMKNYQIMPDDEILKDALQTMQDPYSLERVSLLKSLSVGSMAYNFSLPDVNNVHRKLDEFKGKVVLMDFWYASCTPCRKYIKNVLAPVKAHFKDNPNVVFITVSTDNYDTFSGMVKRADFLPEGGVHLYTDNKRFKHPMMEYYQISTYPYPLLIGKEGKLLAFKEELTSIELLISKIEAAL